MSIYVIIRIYGSNGKIHDYLNIVLPIYKPDIHYCIYFSQDCAAQTPSVKPVGDNNLKAEGKKENEKKIDKNEKEIFSGLTGTVVFI